MRVSFSELPSEYPGTLFPKGLLHVTFKCRGKQQF